MRCSWLLLSTLMGILSRNTLAQPASISIGPTAGIIQYGVQLLDDFPPSYRIKAIPGSSFGLDITYTKNRVLLNGQLLSSTFLYQVTNTLQLTASQQIPYEIKTSAHVYSLPLTVAYQLIRNPRFHLYAGLGISAELNGLFRTKSTDFNSGYSSNLSSKAPLQPFVVGSHLQVIARYPINNRWIVQLNPILRYYPLIDIPLGQRTKVALGTTLTACLKLK